jgi:predicted PurR-regulated permease PerM
VATLLVFLNALLVLGLMVVLTAGAVTPDLSRLAANTPAYVRQSQGVINELLARYPQIADQVAVATASLQIQDLLAGAAGLLTQAPMVFGVATGAFGGLFHLLFTLIIALYLTIDSDHIRRYMIQFLPPDRHEHALRVTERIGQRLGGWARGQLVLSLIVGFLTCVGALVLGLPYVAVLTLIATIGELIPNLGPFIAAVPLVIVGFLSSPTQGVLALGLAILIQQLENNLIAPRVMGHAVELHPLVVMVAILAGNELLGIVGALLAVPVAASLAVVVEEIQEERLARRLAVEEAEAAAAADPVQ